MTELHNRLERERVCITELTLLDRLYWKQLLERPKDGLAFLCTPTVASQSIHHQLEDLSGIPSG